jgi:hypothetical protein
MLSICALEENENDGIREHFDLGQTSRVYERKMFSDPFLTLDPFLT